VELWSWTVGETSQIMSREGKPKSVRAQDEAWPWHMRFGHLHLIKKDGKRDVQTKSTCEACILGKDSLYSGRTFPSKAR
jgi:hypothetical protein